MCISGDHSLKSEGFKNNRYIEYYQSKNRSTINYVVSFYVKYKLNSGSYVKGYARVSSSNVSDMEMRVNLDVLAYDSWQYVEIPFSLLDNTENKEVGITKLVLKLESDEDIGRVFEVHRY